MAALGIPERAVVTGHGATGPDDGGAEPGSGTGGSQTESGRTGPGSGATDTARAHRSGFREYLGLARSLAVYWRPGRQRALRRLYAPFVGPGDLVFDVGAHVGDRTAAFSALGARVVALEPQPLPARWLERTLARRRGVTVLRRAAGPEAGTARLAVSAAHPTVSTLAHDWKDRIGEANESFSRVRWNASVEVPVTTLDALIEEHGVPRFCKVDVEGFEARVLAGLSRPVPALSLEFVAGTLDVTEACIDRLGALGRYRYNVIPGEGRSFHFPRWQEPDRVLEWLRAGAGGASSGDLYALLQDDLDGARPTTEDRP